MHLVCPECKNDVDVSRYPHLAPADVVECDVCGITLGIENIADGEVAAEVGDEGK